VSWSSASCEILTGYGPFVWERTWVTRLPTSGTQASEVGRGIHSTSRVARRHESSIEEDTCQEIQGSRELGSSQGKGPSIGHSKSRGCEAREKDSHWIQIIGGPLDLRGGSCLRTSQEKVREFGRGDREIARRCYPDSWRAVWAIAKPVSGIQVARRP
jgi:hypothetical protein